LEPAEGELRRQAEAALPLGRPLLAPGKLGDVVVLSQDLFTLGDPMDILAAQVDLTVLGGQVVYECEGV
jgi:predicted amidohydrolase YtcJ